MKSNKLIAPKDSAREETFPDSSVDGINVADPISIYFRELGYTSLLTREQEIKLAKQMEKGQQAQRRLDQIEHTSDEKDDLKKLVERGNQAREHLIKANTRLVVSIAKKYIGLGLPFTDLIQAGNIGLIKAVDRFDHRIGAKLSTYATWWIRQSVTRTLQQQKRNIRIPAHIGTRVRELVKTDRRLEQELGREPTSVEIAREMDTSPAQVRWLREISIPTLSLDLPVDKEGETELADFIQDERSPSPAQTIEKRILSEELDKAFKNLTQREARVLELRFGLNGKQPNSLRELGKKLGVSRERVRQIQSRAYRKLRQAPIWRQLKEWIN